MTEVVFNEIIIEFLSWVHFCNAVMTAERVMEICQLAKNCLKVHIGQTILWDTKIFMENQICGSKFK